jgi:uncharacterized protein (DUF302 family)
MDLSLAADVHLPEDHAAAIARVSAALKAEGFGVLTSIDMQAAFREKLGAEFRPYTILGACNPPLAFRAISAESLVGLMLPCNVTVEAAAQGGSVVRFINPDAMMGVGTLGASPALAEVAADATARLSRVAAALRGG